LQKRALDQQLKALEVQIEAIETELEKLAHDMCDVRIYSDPESTKAIVQKQKALQVELDEAYALWAELTDEQS